MPENLAQTAEHDQHEAFTPLFPAGTPEYDAYADKLRAELRKFASGEASYEYEPPAEPVVALAEEYGQTELDHDRNPTGDGLVRWMAERLVAARAEIARRDEPPAAFSGEPGRADYIAGLRALATTLEHNPDLELPYTGRGGAFCVIPRERQREQVAVWARVMPGEKTKDASSDGRSFYLNGNLAGLKICVIANRDEVCERVVVGTREIVEKVPDPDAVAALPTVTQTRTEEIVEWRCNPVLADTQAPDRAAASTNLSPGPTEAREDAPAAPTGGATKSGPHDTPPGTGGRAGDTRTVIAGIR